jgi:geranylgeranyl diphosphate synthase type II
MVAAACSLELIHTYSLIHDDLPALDNDDYRRGKLTNHKVFGDAMAILAGDALLTLAFQVLAQLDAPDDRKTRLIAELAAASGTVGGMIGGQVADLEGEGKPPERATARDHPPRQDRGAAARQLRMGAICAGAGRRRSTRRSPATANTSAWRSRLWTTSWTWKSPRKRSARPPARTRRSTRSPSRRSTAWKTSRRMAQEECERAHAVLEPFGDRALRLHELADLIVRRKS